MTMQASGTDGFTFPDNTTQKTAFAPGMRNKIINGAMMIDQRNAGAAVTVNNNTNNYTLDRWDTYGQPTDGVFTVQQVADAPTGFVNSLKVTVTTADASIGAAQSYAIRYSVEGSNVSDFAWGSGSAATVALSFWVKSSVAGAYSVGFINGGYSRAYPASFTINAANAWEYKTIVLTGDTTGTWLTNSSTGIRLWWSLGSGAKTTANVWNAGTAYTTNGSVDLISTLNATLQITGVQLEKGATATPFENRLYGTELALCQRYYVKLVTASGNYANYGSGVFQSGSLATAGIKFPVSMRSAPSVAQSGTGCFNGTAQNAVTGVAIVMSTYDSAQIDLYLTSAATAGQGCVWNANNNTSAYVTLSSEL